MNDDEVGDALAKHAAKWSAIADQRVLLAKAKAHAWKATPASFAEFLSEGEWRRAAHLNMLSHALADAAYTPHSKIIFSLPMGRGKSEISSRWFPLWYLDRFPKRRLILLGHGQNFATKWGRRVRNLARMFKPILRMRLAETDRTAAHDWETTLGGSMLSSGVMGGFMGERFDMLVIDDYCKSPEQALSANWRDKMWEQYESAISTRARPHTGSMVVVCSRWHPDDLAGRLLSRKEGWVEIKLPAICEGPGDPLGRKPGDILWPEMFTQRHVDEEMRKPRWIWRGSFQQDPEEGLGDLFEKESYRWWRWIRPDVIAFNDGERTRLVRLRDLTLFSTVDLSTSGKKKSDWLVIHTWGVDASGRLFLIDEYRAQIPATKHDKAMLSQQEKHETGGTYVEATAFQLSSVQRARAAGVNATKWLPKGSKEARALAAAISITEGEVFFPRHAHWMEGPDGFLAELAIFPEGNHDDRVDTLSCAVAVKERVRRTKKPRKARVGGGAGPVRARK